MNSSTNSINDFCGSQPDMKTLKVMFAILVMRWDSILEYRIWTNYVIPYTSATETSFLAPAPHMVYSRVQ